MAWNHYQRIMATPYPCIFQISHEWLSLEYIKRNPADNEDWEVCFPGFTSLGYIRKHRIAGWWLFLKPNITLENANWLFIFLLFILHLYLGIQVWRRTFLPHPITVSVYNHELFLKSSLWKFITVIIPFDFKIVPKLRRVSSCVSLNCYNLSMSISFVFWKNKVLHAHFVLSLYQTWAM